MADLSDDEIREIWDKHRSHSLLARAMGPDPVAFARDIIHAAEAKKACNDDPSWWALGSNPRAVNVQYVHKGPGTPYCPDFDE